MQQLTDYYIMMIDGDCHHVRASSKVDAFEKIQMLCGYNSLESAFYDINLCEWKTEFERIVEQYNDDGTTTMIYHVDTPYQLIDYVNLIKNQQYEISNIEE